MIMSWTGYKSAYGWRSSLSLSLSISISDILSLSFFLCLCLCLISICLSVSVCLSLSLSPPSPSSRPHHPPSLSFCLSVSLPLSVSLCLSDCLAVCQSRSQSVCLSVNLSLPLSVSQSPSLLPPPPPPPPAQPHSPFLSSSPSSPRPPPSPNHTFPQSFTRHASHRVSNVFWMIASHGDGIVSSVVPSCMKDSVQYCACSKINHRVEILRSPPQLEHREGGWGKDMRPLRVWPCRQRIGRVTFWFGLGNGSRWKSSGKRWLGG